MRLTRSKDGSSGTATFVFNQPAVFEASGELGDITGLYLIDTEGELSTVDVQVIQAVMRRTQLPLQVWPVLRTLHCGLKTFLLCAG